MAIKKYNAEVILCRHGECEGKDGLKKRSLWHQLRLVETVTLVTAMMAISSTEIFASSLIG